MLSGAALIALITAITAIVGSFVTWRIAKRTSSGAIDTSQASDLWAEGGAIRGELRADLASTKTALQQAASAVTALNEELRLSREKTDAAVEEIRLSRQETRALKAQITKLTAQINDLHRAQMEALSEVKTYNTLTLGAMADNAESRRILAVPKAERTEHEREHLRTAPERLSDDLAASQEGDDHGS